MISDFSNTVKKPLKCPSQNMDEQPGQRAPFFAIAEVAQATDLPSHFPDGF
jgi:hypothetical protein